jgi:tetratricopeptide (TPR) repeat protein
MPPLSEAVQADIGRLCALGDAEADLGCFPQALSHYWAAWDLLPEPQTDYLEATWILAAVGDVNFLGRDYEAGRDNLSTVMHCPGAIGVAFLHFRLGQCLFEIGDEAAAADELLRAFHGGGDTLFDDEDPKYLDCVERAMAAGQSRRAWRFWK